MATWSLLESFTALPHHTASDLSNLIWFALENKSVYEYDVDSDTKTQIADSSSFDSGAGASNLDNQFLCYFNGKLYVGTLKFSSPNYFCQVYQYDGSNPLTGWTKVLDVSTGTAVQVMSLHTDGSELVMTSSEGYDRYSSNGTSWNSGSLGTYNWLSTFYFNHNGTQKGVFYNINGTLKEYDGAGAWSTVESSSTYRTSGPDNHWRNNGGNREYASSFPASWTNPSTSVTAVSSQINMHKDCAFVKDGSNNIYLHLFDGSDWDSGEFVVNSSGISIQDEPVAHQVIRFTDGRAFIAVSATVGNDVQLYGRSAAYAAVDELRYLGMTADAQYLYATALADGTLTLYTYDHSGLTETAASTFGSGTFAELDARTRGIFPAHTYLDGIVLLRGRDGSDVAAQKSTDSGATFSSLDDGTWGATDYAIGLFVDVMNQNDLICVFSNDNIYRSTDGGSTWTKVDDAPDTLRTAARHLVRENDLMVAETTGGDLHITNNAGLTFTNVSDGSIGVVNAIERVWET